MVCGVVMSKTSRCSLYVELALELGVFDLPMFLSLIDVNFSKCVQGGKAIGDREPRMFRPIVIYAIEMWWRRDALFGLRVKNCPVTNGIYSEGSRLFCNEIRNPRK